MFMVKNTYNTSDNTNATKRGRGRPRKIVDEVVTQEVVTEKTAGVPCLFMPTEHDIHDELSYFDSYSYSRYNE
jgi:hypothetical protein